MSIFCVTSSGGTPTANEHSPSPSEPTWRWPSSRRRGAPQRRVRLLHRLGLHPARRHLPVLAVEGRTRRSVQQPTTDSMASCHICARLVRVDAEALQLGAGRRAPGADVDAPVGDEVEHGDRLGRADRVVVRLGHQPHAVAEPDALGPRRDRAVEHLRVRAVRELLEEVVLDGPEGVPPEALAGDGLFERVAVRLSLASGSTAGRRGSRRTVRIAWAPPVLDGGSLSDGRRRGRGRLEGKDVLVTGAASGIGPPPRRGVGRRGRVNGADIVEPAVAERRASTCCDVTDEAAVAAMVAAAVDRTAARRRRARGGRRRRRPGALLDEAEWHRVIAMNLTGTFLVVQARGRADARTGADRRRAGLDRERRKHRGRRGHRRRQRVHAVEGRRGHADQEPWRSTTAAGASASTRCAPASSTRR